LTATATHDTKRGEDARLRILSLSELADDWSESVKVWRNLNANVARTSGASRMPSAAHEYMLYQALLGAWPLEGIDDDFVERIQAYAVKAAREGKEKTSWLAPNEGYEAGLKDFLQRILDRHHSAEFLNSFDAFARRAALIGALNSLSQVALKATMPGVPDFYQGTELWDLSLVDPDNRRPVDFAARAAMLKSNASDSDWSALARDWPTGSVKLALTHSLLALRQRFARLFTDGSYHSLEVTGPHHDEIAAFARVSGRDAVIVVVGRMFGRTTEQGRVWPARDAWNGTSVSAGEFSSITAILPGKQMMPGPQLLVPELFHSLPVAILQAEYIHTPAKRAAAKRSLIGAA
jgi:(1->4)-alpha-D-glucan 1-alpha-D-glucosylmutase